MTRAVVVVVERSPGGGHGWYTELGGERVWRPGTLSRVAFGWVRRHLIELGATKEECGRVVRLLLAELARKKRAEVTAEVEVPEPTLTPLTPAEPETCVSAYAAAIVRTYAQVRTVEAANDAYVALARFDRSEAPTKVEGGADV